MNVASIAMNVAKSVVGITRDPVRVRFVTGYTTPVGLFLLRRARGGGNLGPDRSSRLVLPSFLKGVTMGIFRRKHPKHFVPVHADNVSSTDWVIVLEAGTIIGPSPRRLRVAKATLERKFVRKYDFFFRAKHFLLLEGHDPRVHAVYFCPQLYRYDSDKLVALEGEEIGQLIAVSVESGVVERHPWYEPIQKLPAQPIISAPTQLESRAVVLELPPPRGVGSADGGRDNSGPLAETEVSAALTGRKVVPAPPQDSRSNGSQRT